MTRMPSALVFAALLSGCSTATETASIGGVAVEATGRSAAVGPISAGVAEFAVTLPAPEDRLAQPLLGPWTLARSGDPVCTVDLGSRNAVGEFTARTRRCASIELARIASWAPAGEGLVLYDFERRPTVALAPVGRAAFEGTLADGARLTLWR